MVLMSKLIEKDSLRRSLGIVLQDTHLFTGTITENIAYGRSDATREEILEAARIANVDSFVQHLDNGYDTVLTDDGAGLSNGATSAYRHCACCPCQCTGSYP